MTSPDGYLPAPGSLNAAFECLSAYHLTVREQKRPNRIHEATRSCEPMAKAVEVFYP